MACTIGLINELHFISKSLNTQVCFALKTDRTKRAIDVQIKDDVLNIFYANNHIWREKIGVPSSLFGVESVQTIAQIIFFIDNNNDNWKKLIYFEK